MSGDHGSHHQKIFTSETSQDLSVPIYKEEKEVKDTKQLT